MVELAPDVMNKRRAQWMARNNGYHPETVRLMLSQAEHEGRFSGASKPVRKQRPPIGTAGFANLDDLVRVETKHGIAVKHHK